MLDLRDLSLEGVERLCQVDMTWKLVPLYITVLGKKEKCVESLSALSWGFFKYPFSNRALQHERLCQVDMTWKLVPLYITVTGKKEKRV